MHATLAPLSHRFAKKVVRSSMALRMEEALKWESRSFRDVAFAADLKKGVTLFKERREAKFWGNWGYTRHLDQANVKGDSTLKIRYLVANYFS
jgi:hypothetical protein